MLYASVFIFLIGSACSGWAFNLYSLVASRAVQVCPIIGRAVGEPCAQLWRSRCTGPRRGGDCHRRLVNPYQVGIPSRPKSMAGVHECHLGALCCLWPLSWWRLHRYISSHDYMLRPLTQLTVLSFRSSIQIKSVGDGDVRDPNP